MGDRMTVIARDMARRIAATLPQLYDIDYLEPGGEPVEADMVALVETVLRDANTQGAVETLRLLWDDIRETDKRFVPNDVRAKVDAVLGGQ